MISLRHGVLFVVAAFLLSLISCATGNPWHNTGVERLTSDDCLVLIPTAISLANGTPESRNYTVYLNDSRIIKIGPKDNSYVAIIVRNSDTRLVSLHGEMLSDGKTAALPRDMDKTLPYARGKVIVAPFVFTQYRRMENGVGITGWKIDPLKSGLAEEILALFMQTADAEDWKQD